MTADAYSELESVRRDIASILPRLEWLDRYVNENADLEAELVKLRTRERQLTKKLAQSRKP